MRSNILKREDLYREVWSRPITHVAKDYGISDVGLAMACRRRGVPRPPVGYGAKREAGHELEIPPLPPLSGEMRPAVEVRASRPEPSVNLLPEPKIEAPERLRSPHPLVKLTRDELRGAGTDDYGRISPRDPQGLEIRVSPGQLTRALRVAEGLIRGLDRLGYPIELRNRWNRQFETCALIEGEEVRFSIWEPSRRSVKPADGSRWSYDRYVYTPTGDLELRIDEYVSIGTAKTIRDRPSGKVVEHSLGRFVVSMHAAAQVMKSERLQRERDEERRQAVLREQQQRERESAYQSWLVQDLVKKASAHREACTIRQFLEDLEIESSNLRCRPDKAWIAWAHGVADQMDPLRNGRELSAPLQAPDSWKRSGETGGSFLSAADPLGPLGRSTGD